MKNYFCISKAHFDKPPSYPVPGCLVRAESAAGAARDYLTTKDPAADQVLVFDLDIAPCETFRPLLERVGTR